MKREIFFFFFFWSLPVGVDAGIRDTWYLVYISGTCWISYRKLRYIEISFFDVIYRTERILPSISWNPRALFFHTSDRWSVWSVWSVWSIPTTVHDLDLADQIDSWTASSTAVARVARWEPYNLHDLSTAHASWVGSVLNRSFTNMSQRQGRI